jgi:hypothetical protein
MCRLLITTIFLVAALAVVDTGAAKTSGPITTPDDTTLTIASGDTTVAYNWSADTAEPEPDSLFRCLNDNGGSIIGGRNGPGSVGGTLDLGPGTYNFTCYQYVADPTAPLGLRFVISASWSVTVNLLTGVPQTASFTSSPPSHAAVNGHYTPTATATSGLPVSIKVDSSSESVCSLATGVVTFSAVGECVLDANQSGDAQYAAAAEVKQVMSVDTVCVGALIPRGYVFTALVNDSGCGDVNKQGYNALRLNVPNDGIVVCIKYKLAANTEIGNSIPPGYQVTALVNDSGCGPIKKKAYNAERLNTV